MLRSSALFLWLMGLPLFCVRAQEGGTCELGNFVFQAGEPLGDLFTTLCGTASEFPCYCDPRFDPPISCPYCGLTTEDGLVCARDGESSSIVNLDGIPQTCECQVDSDGIPRSVCQDDFCSVELVNGNVLYFADGESYRIHKYARCGYPGEFPCFCNTALPGKVECPYCGFETNTGDLACARKDETITFLDADNQATQCYCGEDLSSTCEDKIPTLRPTTKPTKIPTQRPTQTPTHRPTQYPTKSPTQRPTEAPSPAPTGVPTILAPGGPVPTVPTNIPRTASPTPAPTTIPTKLPTTSPTKQPTSSPTTFPTPVPTQSPTSSPTDMPIPQFAPFDKPAVLLADRAPVRSPAESPSSSSPGCTFFNVDTGRANFIQPEESFGKHVQGPCGPSEEWPAFCNPGLPTKIEYPYCMFSPTGSGGDVVCGNSGDIVSVPTSEGTTQECSCLFLNPLLGPVSSCPDLAFQLTTPLSESFTESPTDSPTTETTTIRNNEASESVGLDPTVNNVLSVAGTIGTLLLSLWL